MSLVNYCIHFGQGKVVRMVRTHVTGQAVLRVPHVPIWSFYNKIFLRNNDLFFLSNCQKVSAMYWGEFGMLWTLVFLQYTVSVQALFVQEFVTFLHFYTAIATFKEKWVGLSGRGVASCRPTYLL